MARTTSHRTSCIQLIPNSFDLSKAWICLSTAASLRSETWWCSNTKSGGAPMQNYYVPMVQQGQQPQHPTGRYVGVVMATAFFLEETWGMVHIPCQVGGVPIKDVASIPHTFPLVL